jgi:hypothetical protein
VRKVLYRHLRNRTVVTENNGLTFLRVRSMKQPLVECDMLVEVAADGMTPQRGDFLVCYFTDPQQRRAIAVKVFRQTTINGQATEEVLRLPAPPTRLKPKSKIDWSRALGAPLHSNSRSGKIRQYIFDTSEKGQIAFRIGHVRRFKAARWIVDNVTRPLIEKKYLEKVVDDKRLGYRFTEAGRRSSARFRQRGS